MKKTCTFSVFLVFTSEDTSSFLKVKMAFVSFESKEHGKCEAPSAADEMLQLGGLKLTIRGVGK